MLHGYDSTEAICGELMEENRKLKEEIEALKGKSFLKGFIEIIDRNVKKRLINIRHIEEVAERDEDSCYIYLMHNCPNAIEQDYYIVGEPYEVIKMLMIEKGR